MEQRAALVTAAKSYFRSLAHTGKLRFAVCRHSQDRPSVCDVWKEKGAWDDLEQEERGEKGRERKEIALLLRSRACVSVASHSA